MLGDILLQNIRLGLEKFSYAVFMLLLLDGVGRKNTQKNRPLFKSVYCDFDEVGLP